MTRFETRAELLFGAEEEYAKLHELVAELPEDLREVPGVSHEWSVKDILAQLDVWHEMFLRWEAVGSTGAVPAMPAEGYTWAQGHELAEEIFERHKHDHWEAVVERLDHSYKKVLEVISCHTDEDLFSTKRFDWTGSTSMAAYANAASASHYIWARELIEEFVTRLATTASS